MKPKSNKIQIASFDDTTVVGINSALVDYKLACSINNKLSLDLARHDDLIFEGAPFSFFYYTAGENYNVYNLVSLVCKDKVLFSEVSPRPHDTGMVTMISQDLSEFALHARAILGLPIPNIAFHGPSASKAIVVEGESDHVKFSGLEDVLAEPDTALRLFGKPELKGHRRMGVLLARRDTVEEAKATVMAMREKVKVTL